MKKEILTLIIGILIGAIIATGVFLALKGNTNGNMGNMGEPPAMDGNSINGGKGHFRQQDNAQQGNSIDMNNSSVKSIR